MLDDEENTKNGEGGLIAYFGRQAHSYGAEFFVDGELMSPNDIVRRTVMEEGTYMADYILNEVGKIAQVRLDRVKVQ